MDHHINCAHRQYGRCPECEAEAAAQQRAAAGLETSQVSPSNSTELLCCGGCKKLKDLITRIHDKLEYEDVYGWDDGDSAWDEMREIAYKTT